jgi:hypothetical protein
LPPADPGLTYRALRAERLAARWPVYYQTALRYGQTLWMQGHAGRAILAVTRGLYSRIAPDDPVLGDWPLPYAALRWLVASHPSTDFPGNPRVSFQHQATRLAGPRAPLLRARAWAVWSLVREARPELPGDPRQQVVEPDLVAIRKGLITHGHEGEAALWARALHR